jgi:hypothetical protein
MTTANDQIVAALKRLDQQTLAEVFASVKADKLVELKAAAAANENKNRILKIAAMREKRDRAFLGVEGDLKRLGIDIEEVSRTSIDKLFASAAPKTGDRLSLEKWDEKKFELKTYLGRLGLI